MEDDVAKCMAAGFNHHLTKPLNFKELELCSHRWLPASHDGHVQVR